MTRVALIYLRKSNLQNVDNDLAAHEARCLAKARERGDLAPQIVREEEGHRSAYSDTKRPGYRQVESLIGEGRVSVLYVNDRARIWRNAVEWLNFLTFCRKHDTEIIPAIEPPIGDVSDPNSQLLEFINGWQREQYRTAVSNSLRATKRDLKQAGLFAGNWARFGLTLVGSKLTRQLEPNADFSTVIEILTLYVSGNGCDTIARVLNARGRTWKYGKRRVPLQVGTLRQFLTHLETYRPFLDPLLYEQSIANRAARAGRKQNGARTKHPRLLLYMVLFCAGCGARYYTEHRYPSPSNAVRTPHHAYQHAPHIPCDTPKRMVKAEIVDAQVWAQLTALQQFFIDHAPEIEAQLLTAPDGASERLDYELTRERLEQELANLRRNYNRGDFGEGDDARAFFTSEQSRLQNALTALFVPPEPAPRAHMDMDALARFRDAPLVELRLAAEADPDAGNEWARSIIARATIWDSQVKIELFGGLSP